jgi:para-nitrobenzyl esterase
MLRKSLITTLILYGTMQLFAQKINDQVLTKYGPIVGYTKGKQHIYKGIPFAAPPIGDLRWRPTQAPLPWTSPKDCKVFGPSPYQSVPLANSFWSSEYLIPSTPISEDCLYLNVWTEAKTNTEKRPVIVYIYGGGFRSGGAGCAVYDGEGIASKGVVFVTFNYRLGNFGFLAHPDLSAEATSSGNYALLDMIAALQWVQNNIGAFGGDASNVTLAGQSAGAMALSYLVASPMSKGLFHKVIAQSGGNFLPNLLRPAISKEEAEERGVNFANDLNCSNITELRAKSAAEIFKAQGGLQSPYVDGYILPQSVRSIFENGQQNDVPTIVGWNADDRVSKTVLNAEAFNEQVQARFGDMAAAFLDAYPANTNEKAAAAQIAMARDEIFGVQNYTWAKLQHKTGKQPVFVYNFNKKLPAYTTETQYGAFHSGEIPYAYNNLAKLDRPWELADQKVAQIMSDYWVNFAKTGNPNGKKLPLWIGYKADTEFVMVIDDKSDSVLLPTKKQLEFWEKYYVALLQN